MKARFSSERMFWFLVAFCGILFSFGCTSSSTNVATNPSYERDYTTSTRSRQTATQPGGEFPQETYKPPVTLMLIAMKTNEVLPGETYPIVAVVDNPENRDLSYKWTVESGKFSEVPESMRSELLSYLEELKKNKGVTVPTTPAPQGETKEGGQATKPPSGLTPESSATSAASEGAEATTKPSSPQTTKQAEETGQAEETKEQASGQTPKETTEGGQETTTGQTSNAESSEQKQTPDQETPNSAGAGQTVAMNEAIFHGDKAEKSLLASSLSGLPWLRYAVLAPEEEEQDPSEAWPKPRPKDSAENEEKSQGAATEPSENKNKVEEPTPSGEGVQQELRKEEKASEAFEGFKPEAGTGRLVEVEKAKEKEESQEKSEVPLVSLNTGLPFVLWTPETTGNYTIRLTVLDTKGNELTPERSLPVTVTEPKPKTKLVWNTSQKLNEEDYLVVELRGENIPQFRKGLFTITYDPTKVSFKLAEIGSFFSKEAENSIYYAEPPGKKGSVTLALATEAVDLPKGDGTLARLIFRVKEAVSEPRTLDFKEVTTEDARYILNVDGDNVLPAPIEKPAFATEWVEPPPRPTQTRPSAGQEVPQTPQPPATQRPQRPELGGTQTSGQSTPTEGTTPPTSESTLTTPGAGTQAPSGSAPPPAHAPGILQRMEEQRAHIQEMLNSGTLSDEERKNYEAQLAQIESDIERMKQEGATS